MKLRISGANGLFDATLLVDCPDSKDLGHAAALCISWIDGEKVFAGPSVAIQRCKVIWATSAERRLLIAFGFLPNTARGR